jgi:hypothetical protein
MDEVVPPVDAEDPEHLVGVGGDARRAGVEAGAVEEADDPGDHEDGADEGAVETGWAGGVHFGLPRR